MHEYSLVQSLVHRVETEAEARQALGVHRLVVQIGELSGVDPELLASAYDLFRAGTVCEKAELQVRRVAATWRCSGCRAEIPRGEVLTCTACGLPAELAEGGDQILLETIEMEVP
jgi:hydrogenase nickel incorporation protein HypA/HybF